ncbi:MAG: formate dehydrogenase accessory sulfurtransferase FdhD [Deltaproteobacteria bacterium]|jgi:FdhD protein|nr:formate dehydrogenase accessory sulfurtransferase FdhD [Deltaproteobacteria bacterium]
MKTLHEALIIRLKGDHPQETTDRIATEIGFSLKVNDKQVVTLLCTPSELDAMAVGFLLSEGLLQEQNELLDLQVDEKEFTVSVTLKGLPENIDNAFHKKTITSGCGRGITFTDAESLKHLPPNRSDLRIAKGDIPDLMRKFRSISKLFLETGGVHSAALADRENILLFAEDIGRHNAVDKLIGKAFLEEIPVTDKILLSSGRISGEIMTKVIRNRIPVIISRTAPTCMSITHAEDHGVTLIGFARGDRMNIYTHPQRVILNSEF